MQADTNKGHVPCRGWSVSTTGMIDNLTLNESTVPLPGDGEVRILVKAIGVNFPDVLTVLGVHTEKPSENNPVTLGLEVAGVVDVVGSSVSDRFSPGQRVWALMDFGAYCTVLNVDADLVFEIPGSWSFSQAAAFPLQTVTAYVALVIQGGIPIADGKDDVPTLATSRKVVLVHSAAGGVGQRILQLLQKANGTAICVVGSMTKAQYLQEHFGIQREHIIVRGGDETSPEEFGRVLKERALGGGVNARLDAVMDSYNGSYFYPAWESLRLGGRYVVYGMASLLPVGRRQQSMLQSLYEVLGMAYRYFTRPKLDILACMDGVRSLSMVNMNTLLENKAFLRAAINKVIELNLPAPTVSKEYQFEAAREALQFMYSGQSVGKLCLLVE